MSVWQETYQTSKQESNLLVLFVPSVDRASQAIDQDRWVGRTLEILGNHFGGATAFPRGRGVWRDDDQGGQLIYDDPVVVHCYTNEEALERSARALREFLIELGRATRQGAVGLVIDRDYLEIRFQP